MTTQENSPCSDGVASAEAAPAAAPSSVRVIAVDGPAGAGKSSAAEGLARRIGAVRLDTGAIYRSLALAARRAGVDWEDGPGLAALARSLDLRFDPSATPQAVYLAGEEVTREIRSPEMSRGASRVSRHPAVREALLGLQRRLAAQAGLVVAEGRDMGTTVFPDALVKVYLTASDEARARRRWLELREQGVDQPFEAVLAEQRRRDELDRTRAVSPLVQADDAVVIDSTDLSLEQVVNRMVALVRRGAPDVAQYPAGARTGSDAGDATAGDERRRAAMRDPPTQREELERRLQALKAELRDREVALPAHSVRAHQIAEIEELEEQIAELEETLSRLP